jgi:phosphoribosylaminoimidazole carboxylase/phosphoribosylaminoimidazole-succinocarboxamide synthase
MMTTDTKGGLLAEGKTKKIWAAGWDYNFVIIENKTDITAFDDPKFTKQFQTKAKYATTTTCRVFELLKKAGIPVAYTEQISDTEFVAPRCSMIPLEVVARRYAVGSYLKRNPNLEQAKGQAPLRFHRLVAEFFLKTTKGRLVNSNGEIVVEGLDPEKGEEDPLILNPENEVTWTLCHSKKPLWDPASILRERIGGATKVIGNTPISDLESILRDTFLVLEGTWATLGCRLIDMKIEFGTNSVGEPLVADVIDNDSWRLRDQDWKELSKEAFRQGEALDKVERKYGVVSNLINGFRMPKQCLVIWQGSNSDKDSLQILKELDLSNISLEAVILSGHRSPQCCLQKLEQLLSQYPDGGAIVVKVGKSNGLGPMLAARTSWPVITFPATLDTNPEDIWSSVRLPTNVPMAVSCPWDNAINFALRILSQKNPVLYQQIQKRVEDLDC